MVVDFDLKKEFIPEWNKNKELPELEQVVVEHFAPTGKLKDKLIDKPSMIVKADPKGDKQEVEIEYKLDTKRIVRGMGVKIKNLKWKDRDIKTVEDCYGDGVPQVFTALVDEIGQYLQSLLQESEIDTKN